MNKRIYKLLKRGFLVLLFLVTLLLFLIPVPVFSSDVQPVKDIPNDINKIMDEDFHLFCLANFQEKSYPNESAMIHEDLDRNYEISSQSS
jgi:hypothetical protein